MICIERQLVVGLLTGIDKALRDIPKIPKKRLSIIMTNTVESLNLLPVIDTDELVASAQAAVQAPEPGEWNTPETEIVEELVPMAPYSPIGKPCMFCKNCKARVKQKDNYCRKCGYKFRKETKNNVD
jgi:hypothetical protein